MDRLIKFLRNKKNSRIVIFLSIIILIDPLLFLLHTYSYKDFWYSFEYFEAFLIIKFVIQISLGAFFLICVFSKKQNSLDNEELTRILNRVFSSHLYLELLNKDLEYEFGESILDKKIGESKFDDKFYFTLRDYFGSILDEIVHASFDEVKELGLNEDEFRDRLDHILNNPKLYDGSYNRWESSSTDLKSMEWNTGNKYWWSKKK